MTNNRIFIETPIDQTEGLESRDYDTFRPNGDSIIRSVNLYNPKEFGDSFLGWLMYNPPGTTYLRPAPENSVVVSEEVMGVVRNALKSIAGLSEDEGARAVAKQALTKLAQMGE